MSRGNRSLLIVIAAALALVGLWLTPKDFGIGAVVLMVATGILSSALPNAMYHQPRRRGTRRQSNQRNKS